uniref:BACK domain-containing protein n=1 Tax=Glossina austeni TaxID=7395 RepID=A0A1A9V6J1_GLOAU
MDVSPPRRDARPDVQGSPRRRVSPPRRDARPDVQGSPRRRSGQRRGRNGEINKGRLEVKSEDNVYKAMLNWIKHDVNNRKVHLPELMSHITLPILSTHFKRDCFSAVIAADDIYVLGCATSCREWQYVTSVERFNIRNNVWTTIESMEIEHNGGGAAVVSGCFD